jgi:hypothetical protein
MVVTGTTAAPDTGRTPLPLVAFDATFALPL